MRASRLSEMGGGSRGLGTTAGRARANSAAAAKAVAKPKAKAKPVVKTVPAPGSTVKINSGNTTKTPSKPAKPKSYWELKNLPSLVKINSGKGNTTVSPIKYRRKAK